MSEFASGSEPLAQQLPVADELHQSSQTESQDHELEEIEVIDVAELEEVEVPRPTQGQGQEPQGRSSSPSQEQPQEQPRLQRKKVRAENKEPKPDTRQCRICFAGAEEEPELGRLIKPCRCKGSIRYVHVKCIDTWRKTGSVMNSSSFWACPQCGFRYAFARTKILGLSTSPWVLGPTTIALFLIIVFAASFVVSYFVPELDDPTSILNSPFDPNLNYNSGSGSDSSNSNADNSFGSIYSYSWWHSPFGIASEVIKETVQTFAEVSTPQEVRDAREARYLERLEEVKRMYKDDNTLWGRFMQRIPVQRLMGQSQSRKNQGQGQDRSQPPSKSARRVRQRDPREAYSPSEDIRPKISFWARLARKFMLGLSLVGILSFLNLLLTMSLFGPLQIARARWIRNGRREAGGLRDVGTILIIIFVVIGVVRALYGVYVTTRMVAQWVLLRAENAILEVQDDDDDDEDKAEEKKEESEYEYEDAPADKAASTSAPATETATTPTNATATTTARPQTTEEKGEGSNNLTRRPAAINIDTSRGGRDASEDDFGGELPATPGGWRAEWEWS